MAKSNNRVPRWLRALKEENHPLEKVISAQTRLLGKIWQLPPDLTGRLYGNLTFRPRDPTRMIDRFVPLDTPSEIEEVLHEFSREGYDQYFCPNPLTQRRRKVEYVAPTRLAWCDIDEADPHVFEPAPSIIWETSPGRYQGLWFWDEPHDSIEAQEISKALTYNHGGDKGGHAPNKLLRLPGSLNHKPEYDEPLVRLLHFDDTPIKGRPKPLKEANTRHRKARIVRAVDPEGHDRLDVWRKYRGKCGPCASILLRDDRVRMPDRSRAIFMMVTGLHKAGASDDEIAGALWTSPYFLDKYGHDLTALNVEVARIISKLEADQ